jgi:hypothetical protein
MTVQPRERLVEQLRLDLDLKGRAEFQIPLEPATRQELVALMARAILEVHKRAQRSGDD